MLDQFIDKEDFKGDQRNHIQDCFYHKESLLSRDDPLQNKNQEAEKEKFFRCEKCGFPLKLEKHRQVKQKKLNTKEQKIAKSKLIGTQCFICRREQVLNIILMISYIVSISLFITSLVGVFLDQLQLELSLILLCLEIIFLMFFGRFLETMVFFGLSKKEKIIAGLYRFACTGELQAYEIAMRFMKDLTLNNENSQLWDAFLQVILYQNFCLPSDWYEEVSQKLKVPKEQLISKIAIRIVKLNEKSQFNKLVQDAPIGGVFELLRISVNSNNLKALNLILEGIQKEINMNQLSDKFLQELYIYQEELRKACQLVEQNQLLITINEIIKEYQPPNVPSIDAIEEGKTFLQKNPIIAYLLRILFYIVLSLLLGLLFQLLG